MLNVKESFENLKIFQKCCEAQMPYNVFTRGQPHTRLVASPTSLIH